MSDEVYEHLVFDGEHIADRHAARHGRAHADDLQRRQVIQVTGWKIGWCSGPAELVRAVRAVKQFLTFAGGTPLQHAAAAALQLPDVHLQRLRDELRANRDTLAEACAVAGWRPCSRPAPTSSTRTSA